MVFNSLTFLAFFALVLGVHALPLPWRWRKLNLLIASYLFYAAWNPPFVLLLILAAWVDFHLAHWMGRVQSERRRRLILAASICLNLGLLSYFKYGQFLLDNFAALLRLLHIEYAPPGWSIVLPMGISFYTFETISYLVDVYRRRIKPWSSLLDYSLFLTFFPHLVAGPIVRAHDFLPQCERPRTATPAQFSWGLTLLAVGLFEKVILADAVMSPVADRVYRAVGQATCWDAWLGTLAFSGQIFFDFSGYSLCAIGAALCLGFVLNDNFHFPYAALGFSDFWRRWHISLSSWLRDYLYIPLGGNRHGSVRTNTNLLLTMLLGGLWHGAAWRFVAWGGLHGLYLMGERTYRGLAERRGWKTGLVPPILLGLATYLLVCIPWVFFRAESFRDAFTILSAMAHPSLARVLVTGTDAMPMLFVLAVTLAAQWRWRDRTLEDIAAALPQPARCTALAGLLIALTLAPGEDRAFIYFQF